MTYMKAILAGAILGVSAIIPTQVQATDWYAVACITSATGDIVNFSYRWGSNDWKAINVNPGEWHFMSWQYDYANQDRSPPLQITFDQDEGPGVSYATYIIKPYRSSSQNCDEGKRYEFYLFGNQIRVRELD